jgi:hypothetical protein
MTPEVEPATNMPDSIAVNRTKFVTESTELMEKIQKMLEETRRIEAELRNEPFQKEEIVNAITSGTQYLTTTVSKPRTGIEPPKKRARL